MTKIPVNVWLQMQAEKKQPSKKVNKYMAKATEFDGERYDSKKEAEYARKLAIAQGAKNASDRVVLIERQLPFRLEVNGILICKYILDFKVTYADGRVAFVDVKGYKQGVAYRMFKLKSHLMAALYNITVIEV